MKSFKITKIEMPKGHEEKDLIQRLYDFGLHPGVQVEIVAKVSFKSITIIQFGNTRIALNSEEFACLHGH